jgi:hypothetical protein
MYGETGKSLFSIDLDLSDADVDIEIEYFFRFFDVGRCIEISGLILHIWNGFES